MFAAGGDTGVVWRTKPISETAARFESLWKKGRPGFQPLEFVWFRHPGRCPGLVWRCPFGGWEIGLGEVRVKCDPTSLRRKCGEIWGTPPTATTRTTADPSLCSGGQLAEVLEDAAEPVREVFEWQAEANVEAAEEGVFGAYFVEAHLVDEAFKDNGVGGE